MNNKVLVAVATIILVLAVAVYIQSWSASATERPSAAEVPDGTLIIGSHLIAFSALNDEILELALSSVDELKTREAEILQERIYFKSDINNGVWYDITNAQSLTDISLSRQYVVADSVIDGLYLSHWTKSDGITIEFSTGRVVSLQELAGVDDPANLAEMKLLAIEKEVQAGKIQALEEGLTEDSDNDRELLTQIEQTKQKLASIEQVMQPVSSAEVALLNNTLDAFDKLNQQLLQDKQPDRLIALLNEEKAIVKAERDLIVYRELEERVNDATIVASLLDDGDLLGLFGSTIDELNKKIAELEGQADRGPAEQVISQLAQSFADDLLNQLKANNLTAATELLTKLQAIDSINNNRILDRPLELSVLDEASTILASNIRDNSDANSLRQQLAEMGELLDAELFRTDPGVHPELLEEWLNEANQTLDASSGNIATVISEHCEGLAKKIAALKAQRNPDFASKADELNRIGALEDELQEQYFLAAEKGDLEKLENLQEQLQAVRNLLDQERAAAAAEYKSLLDDLARLQDALVKSEQPAEREKLREQIAELQTNMAGLEMVLDDKVVNALNDLDNLKSELGTALANDDMRNAGILAGEIVEALALMPSAVMSDNYKEQQLAAVLDSIEDKAAEYSEQGVAGAADNLMTLSGQVAVFAGENGIGAVRAPTVPTAPRVPYSLVFTDFNVNIRQPLIIKEDSKYIDTEVVFTALGANFTWQEERKRMIIQDPLRFVLVEYTIGKDTIFVNNRRVQLAENLQTEAGKVLLPLSIVLDAYHQQSEERDGVIYASTRR